MALTRKQLFAKYPFLEKLVAEARQTLDPQRIIVFGSRALGVEKHGSDMDVAFAFKGAVPAAWSRFVVDKAEDLPTLMSFDFINMNMAESHILKSIERDGVVIYEKQ